MTVAPAEQDLTVVCDELMSLFFQLALVPLSIQCHNGAEFSDAWVIDEINAIKGCGSLMLHPYLTLPIFYGLGPPGTSALWALPLLYMLSSIWIVLIHFYAVRMCIKHIWLAGTFLTGMGEWCHGSWLCGKIFTWCLIEHVPRTQLLIMQKSYFACNRTLSCFFTTYFFNGQCFQ